MSRIRSIIKKTLLSKGILLSRPPGQFDALDPRLKQARSNGLQVRVAVDGGAADGNWTRRLKAVYPDANVLMVEPRDEELPALQALARELPGLSVATQLLGSSDKMMKFYKQGHQSSVLPKADGESFGELVEAPMTTLDRTIQSLGMPYPDLIKLDLQGAELDCLAGATECLQHAESLILELSFFRIQRGMPLMLDVLNFLSQRGFRWYDILSLWHRPLDGALAQGDALFLHERSALLADSRWAEEAAWT